jgi:hypothetical protein
MKRIIVILALLSLVISACGDMGWVTAAPDVFRITPSRPPTILTLTPVIAYPTTSATLPPPPSLTPSPSLVAGPSPTFTTTSTFTITPTITETPTASPTFTVTPPPLEITLLGCDTGFDITHGMGEVTNAYVIVANRSGSNLTNTCATLASTDESRVHPDKTVCSPSLPLGFQVTFKLTIDTTFQANTIVQVSLTSDQGLLANGGGLACKDIGAFKPEDNIIGVVQPIP